MLITSMLGLAALGLNVALNIALLPQIGIRGASIASSVCYTALALSYVVICRHQGVVGWRDLVPRASDMRLFLRAGSSLRGPSMANSGNSYPAQLAPTKLPLHNQIRGPTLPAGLRRIVGDETGISVGKDISE